MSKKSELFRYHSCRFNILRCKERTARVVLHREFNIMFSFTLESSFQGYYDSDRITHDFLPSHLFQIGDILSQSLFEYVFMKEEEDRTFEQRKKNRQKGLKIKPKRN